jgi:hypothetical protein
MFYDAVAASFVFAHLASRMPSPMGSTAFKHLFSLAFLTRDGKSGNLTSALPALWQFLLN